MQDTVRLRIKDILAKDDSEMTNHDLRFLRARAAYLSKEEVSRLNRIIKSDQFSVGDDEVKVKTIASKDIPDVSSVDVNDVGLDGEEEALLAQHADKPKLTEDDLEDPEAEDLTEDEAMEVIEDEKIEANKPKVKAATKAHKEKVEDPDETEAEGDMTEATAEDLNEDEVELDDEVADEVDIDAMNMDQLREVATDLGIENPKGYNDEEALRAKIYATYTTSSEAASVAEISGKEANQEKLDADVENTEKKEAQAKADKQKSKADKKK